MDVVLDVAGLDRRRSVGVQRTLSATLLHFRVLSLVPIRLTLAIDQLNSSVRPCTVYQVHCNQVDLQISQGLLQKRKT